MKDRRFNIQLLALGIVIAAIVGVGIFLFTGCETVQKGADKIVDVADADKNGTISNAEASAAGATVGNVAAMAGLPGWLVALIATGSSMGVAALGEWRKRRHENVIAMAIASKDKTEAALAKSGNFGLRFLEKIERKKREA